MSLHLTGSVAVLGSVTSSLLGTASLSEQSISASYSLSSSVSEYAKSATYIAPTPITLPDRRQSSWMNGIAYIQGNKILGRGSFSIDSSLSLYASPDSIYNLVDIPIQNRPETFTKLVVDPSTIYAIGSNGLAYTAVGNNNGQLGRGPAQTGNDARKQRSIMAPITASGMSGSGIEVVDVFHASETAQIYNSNYNSVIWKVNDSGQYRYYGAGHNDYGQLALGVTGDRSIPSESVSLRGRNIVSMSMGDAMSGSVFIVNSSSEVLCWGANGQGQLGVGNTTTQLTPIIPRSGSGLAFITASVKDVASVQCGSPTALNPRNYNVFILLDNGTVFCSGYGTSYSRGDGQLSNLNYFTEVKTSASTKLSNIVKLFCRGYVRTALDSSGNLWSWGLNQSGYMGDGSTGGVAYQYAKIIATGVEDVYVFTDTTAPLLLIKQNGEWYGSGEVVLNALPLGYDRDTSDINPREKLESIDHSRVKDFFSVGGWDGSRITGLITQYDDNSLYYNGNTSYIFSAFNATSAIYIPTKVPL